MVGRPAGALGQDARAEEAGRLRARLEKLLRDELTTCWYPRAVDRAPRIGAAVLVCSTSWMRNEAIGRRHSITCVPLETIGRHSINSNSPLAVH